ADGRGLAGWRLLARAVASADRAGRSGRGPAARRDVERAGRNREEIKPAGVVQVSGHGRHPWTSSAALRTPQARRLDCGLGNVARRSWPQAASISEPLRLRT